jgi:hypothetical protein
MDAQARARRVDELMELRLAARQALTPAAVVSDRVLERQWSLWEAGVASEVPSYVPRRWKGPPASASQLLAAAAVRCEDVADRAARALEVVEPHLANRLRIVAAMCDVTGERVVDADERTPSALVACALTLERFRDGLDPELDQFGLDPAVGRAIVAVRRAIARFYLDSPW